MNIPHILSLLPLVIGVLISNVAIASDFQYRVPLSKPWGAAAPVGNGGGSGTTPAGSEPTVPAGTPTPAPSVTPGGTTTPTPAPHAELSVTQLNFNTQATHTMSGVQVLLVNTGTALLELTAPPSMSGSTAFGLGGTTCGANLAPGKSCYLEVMYNPEVVGDDVGVVSFPSNAENAPVYLGVKGSSYNPVSFDNEVAANGLLNSPYSYDFKNRLQVANETHPDKLMASWSVSGTLPPGFSFSSEGVLSGTPTTRGSYTFTIKAIYRSNMAQKKYTIKTGGSCYIAPASADCTPTASTPAPSL